MSVWVLVAALAGALVLGYVLGVATIGRRRGTDGKPWWYDVAFPQPDESTLGALKVLADRYALGEIDVDDYDQRAQALRASASARAESAAASKR